MSFYTIHETKQAGYSYKVEWTHEGPRQRKFFNSKREAKTWAEAREIDVENRGLGAVTISEKLRLEAIEMSALLAKQAPGKSITDAVIYALARWKAASFSKPVAAGLFEFLTKKIGIAESVAKGGKAARKPGDVDRPGYSERYRDDLRLRLAGFGEDFADRMISEIEPRDISNWLEAWPNSAIDQNNSRRCLGVFWSYCVEKGWAASNVVKKVTPAADDGGEIGVLTIDQAARLLHFAPERIQLRLAIGLFTGLRRSELIRVIAEDIKSTKSGEAHLWARVTKTLKTGAASRNIKIRPTLAEWLKAAGPLRSMTVNEFRGDFDKARRLAGVDEWPHNALRHSFCSYCYEAEQNQAALAVEMGHVDTTLIHSNYRNVVSPESAEEFWLLTPARCEEIAEK